MCTDTVLKIEGLTAITAIVSYQQQDLLLIADNSRNCSYTAWGLYPRIRLPPRRPCI